MNLAKAQAGKHGLAPPEAMAKMKGALPAGSGSPSPAAGSLRAALIRTRLKSQAFSIVSNNCWGAHIYRALRIPYQTPFVGLFIMPGCYLALLENFNSLISSDLKFKPRSKYPQLDQPHAANGYYPIGELGGVCEIHFQHYASEAEAKSKWERRRQRMDPHALFFKICDHDGCTPEQLLRFDNLSFARKVAFTSRPAPLLDSEISIPGPVPDGLELSRISPRYFDTVHWLNGGDGRSKFPPWLRFL